MSSSDFLSPASGLVTSRMAGSRTLETVLVGPVHVVAAAEATAPFERLVAAHAPAYWLLDAIGMQGLDPGLASVGVAWLKTFRARGGVAVAVVTTQALLRMVTTSTGSSIGLTAHSFRTRAEAVAWLRSAAVGSDT